MHHKSRILISLICLSCHTCYLPAAWSFCWTISLKLLLLTWKTILKCLEDCDVNPKTLLVTMHVINLCTCILHEVSLIATVKALKGRVDAHIPPNPFLFGWLNLILSKNSFNAIMTCMNETAKNLHAYVRGIFHFLLLICKHFLNSAFGLSWAAEWWGNQIS